MHLVVTIIEKNGQNIGLAIDTYFLRLHLNVNTQSRTACRLIMGVQNLCFLILLYYLLQIINKGQCLYRQTWVSGNACGVRKCWKMNPLLT
jgi:hypothetical protein